MSVWSRSVCGLSSTCCGGAGARPSRTTLGLHRRPRRGMVGPPGKEWEPGGGTMVNETLQPALPDERPARESAPAERAVPLGAGARQDGATASADAAPEFGSAVLKVLLAQLP